MVVPIARVPPVVSESSSDVDRSGGIFDVAINIGSMGLGFNLS